jgi:hypothetical protein
MKGFHALIIALGIVLAGALIAGSNLLYNRNEYIYNPSTDRLSRIDKQTGEVYNFNRNRGWVSALDQ